MASEVLAQSSITACTKNRKDPRSEYTCFRCLFKLTPSLLHAAIFVFVAEQIHKSQVQNRTILSDSGVK
ncbi:hypothetical protein CDAR_379161, partial [Caerostris darwini]